MSKVFIAGLDGATFDLIRPWAAQGKLPTLHRLISEGAWGPLESTIPPMTSPAWPSFATGKYPARHGVFDFITTRGGRQLDVINASAVDASPLWDILSAHGRSVGVINVPVTYPPHAVNGFMITGLLSPSTAQITYPPGLLARYQASPGLAALPPGRRLPRYRVVPAVQYKPGNEKAFIQELEALVDLRALFAAQLMQDHPWDFMMVHFLATDLVQHALWRHMDPTHPHHEPDNPFQDAILHIYQRVDAALGRLLALLDRETTVLVMSDHGFGPLHGVVNLNMLFLREGLLHLKRDPLTQARAFLARHGVTPAQMYGWLVRLNLQNITSRVSKATRNAVFNKFLSFDDVDWSRTIAYSLGHMGQVYINIREREPGRVQDSQGIVERGTAYERACERVIAALRTLTTPDGRPMLERVIRKQENAPGAHAEEGPDLHVVLDGYRYICCPLFATDGNIISKQIRGDSGCHRLHGILIARGPHIRAGGQINDARIIDLAPTTLHLMGHPVPGDMDGRVLEHMLDPAFLARHPIQIETRFCRSASLCLHGKTGFHGSEGTYVLSDQEQKELELRLKGMGYLG